jgi:hypothetical protein
MLRQPCERKGQGRAGGVNQTRAELVADIDGEELGGPEEGAASASIRSGVRLGAEAAALSQVGMAVVVMVNMADADGQESDRLCIVDTTWTCASWCEGEDTRHLRRVAWHNRQPKSSSPSTIQTSAYCSSPRKRLLQVASHGPRPRGLGLRSQQACRADKHSSTTVHLKHRQASSFYSAGRRCAPANVAPVINACEAPVPSSPTKALHPSACVSLCRSQHDWM